MFTVELYAKIRHAVMVDGVSRRETARRFGIYRNTIAKMLQFLVPPGYRRHERPISKKLEVQFAEVENQKHGHYNDEDLQHDVAQPVLWELQILAPRFLVIFRRVNRVTCPSSMYLSRLLKNSRLF